VRDLIGRLQDTSVLANEEVELQGFLHLHDEYSALASYVLSCYRASCYRVMRGMDALPCLALQVHGLGHECVGEQAADRH
jgi:hypothetical protein